MKHALVLALLAALCATGCGSSSKNTAAGSSPTTSVEETTTSPTTTTTPSRVDMTFHAKGTINGVAFDGPVIGDTLRCDPSGNDVQVNWGGTISIKGKDEQIAGDMLVKIGASTTFPNDGTAGLLLGGDYQHRVGATAGTATADAKSGTIDAQYAAGSDQASLQGTWGCA